MRRSLAMGVGMLVAAQFPACGAGSIGEEEREEVPQDESRCLSCDASGQPTAQDPSPTTQKVLVTPSELMFYPTAEESDEFGPKTVMVANLTAGIVAVTGALIADDPKGVAGGRAYFAVEPVTEKIFLGKGEQTAIAVTYLGSTEQESAVLIITTTDPVYHTLVVSLTGKYFVGAD